MVASILEIRNLVNRFFRISEINFRRSVLIERILDLMKKNGIKAAKLTADLGMGKSSVTDWKNKKAKPSYGALVKIAEYFNVSVDYLQGKTDDPNSDESIKSKIELPPDFMYSFYEGYREIDDDDRAILHNLMEKMRIAKKAKDSAQSTP